MAAPVCVTQHNIWTAVRSVRFEVLGFELVAEGFYKVFFRDTELGEFDIEEHGLGRCPSFAMISHITLVSDFRAA